MGFRYARLRAFLALLYLALSAGANAPIAAPREGLLWRIERAGVAPSYLFGTVHVTDPRVRQHAERALPFLDESRILLVELNTDSVDEPAAWQYYLLPERATLAQILPDNLHRRLIAIASNYGLTQRQFERLRPWVMADTLMRGPANAAPWQVKDTLDSWLMRQATDQGIAVQSLTSLLEHARYASDLTEAQQITYLGWAVDWQDTLQSRIDTGIDFYLDENLAALLEEEVAAADSGPYWFLRYWWGGIIVERSRLFLRRMLPELERGGAFVAVGILHLAGDMGLIVMLQQLGWTVTRVD